MIPEDEDQMKNTESIVKIPLVFKVLSTKLESAVRLQKEGKLFFKKGEKYSK